MCISPHPNLWSKGCTDGNTKAITTKDAVRENPVIRNGGAPSSPNSTLPAAEQWIGASVEAKNVEDDARVVIPTVVGPLMRAKEAQKASALPTVLQTLL